MNCYKYADLKYNGIELKKIKLCVVAPYRGHKVLTHLLIVIYLYKWLNRPLHSISESIAKSILKRNVFGRRNWNGTKMWRKKEIWKEYKVKVYLNCVSYKSFSFQNKLMKIRTFPTRIDFYFVPIFTLSHIHTHTQTIQIIYTIRPIYFLRQSFFFRQTTNGWIECVMTMQQSFWLFLLVLLYDGGLFLVRFDR